VVLIVQAAVAWFPSNGMEHAAATGLTGGFIISLCLPV
jgi:hypothetical protein